MRKTNITIILALILVTTALAFNLEVEPVKDTIDLNEISTYNLIIDNSDGITDSLTIKYPGAELDWTIIPVYVADVEGEESQTLLLQ